LKKDNFSIKKYYINRLKKIYLPLLIVISITVILAKQMTFINWFNLKQESLSAIFGYNNFWQLNANLDYFARHVNSPFMHLWYIAILIQFDLVFPIIVIALKKLDKKINDNISTIIVFLLTLLSTLIFWRMSKTQNIMAVYYNTIARSFSILFGVLLAILHSKYNIKFSRVFKRSHTIIFSIYMILLIVLCIFVPADSNSYAIFMILATLISTRLIEYSIIENSSSRVRIEREFAFEKSKFDKALEFIAKISYEVYLVQYPIIFFMHYAAIPNFLKVLITIALTIIVSIILHILLNTKKGLTKIIQILLVSAIILVGGFVVLTEKDHTNEMKELENILNENLKKAEERSKEFLNNQNTDEQEQEKVQEQDSEPDQEPEVITVVDSKEPQSINDKVAETVRNLPVIGIGDSVLLTAINELYEYFPNGYFDGKISRSLKASEELITDLKNSGKLGNTLILALANNGDYSTKLNKEFMELVGDREIYWVNAAGADDPEFNNKFKEFAKDYPNIHIVDWVSVTEEHPEYLYADGVHPKEGTPCKVYAETIYKAIYNQYLKNYKGN